MRLVLFKALASLKYRYRNFSFAMFAFRVTETINNLIAAHRWRGSACVPTSLVSSSRERKESIRSMSSVLIRVVLIIAAEHIGSDR